MWASFSCLNVNFVIPVNKTNLKSLLLSNHIYIYSKERCLSVCVFTFFWDGQINLSQTFRGSSVSAGGCLRKNRFLNLKRKVGCFVFVLIFFENCSSFLNICSSVKGHIKWSPTPFLKALSHLDDLASICRLMKKISKTLAHVEYVMGKFCIR